MRVVVCCILLSAFFAASAHGAAVQDLTPQQVLAKHYESIAPKAKLGDLKTLFAGGVSEFESRMPIVRGGGRVVVISDPRNFYFLMSLNSKDYPFEKIGMFGDNVSLPFTTSGNRSTLGAFLLDNSRVLSDSIFGGTMSLRWINNVASNNSKLKMISAGTKKLDDRNVRMIDVFPGASSGEFKVRLFFDAETFRHVRTEYKRDRPMRGITVGRQNEIADARVDVNEEFSDFKSVDGVFLPHYYKVTLISNTGAQTFVNSWGIRVANYFFNQKLADDFFTFDVK